MVVWCGEAATEKRKKMEKLGRYGTVKGRADYGRGGFGVGKGEEDSASVKENNLVELVVSAVVEKADAGEKALTAEDVLKAIDRGGFLVSNGKIHNQFLEPISSTTSTVSVNN